MKHRNVTCANPGPSIPRHASIVFSIHVALGQTEYNEQQYIKE